MATKIGSGKFKNRQIKTPKTHKTRPSTSYSKKVIFDTLQSYFEEAKILDLFAGSGSLGLEALSRGALSATFVDAETLAIKAIKENIDTLEVNSCCKTIKRDVIKFLSESISSNFDLIFADPPYNLTLESIIECIQLVKSNKILKQNGIFCLELASKNTKILKEKIDIELLKEKTKGETTLLFFRIH